jgi:hypothetical protein
MDENLSDEDREKLRLENEIRKIKMELEKGAKFIEDPDMPSLPPEIENEFLNYIEQFEKMHADSNPVSIYDSIGQPPFPKAEELQDAELSEQLDKLHELLNEHQIVVESVHEVDDREMYRFITEDLFKHEVFMIEKLPGMMTHFTYEEFYPDDVKDVIVHMEEFFDAFFDISDDENLYEQSVSDTGGNQWLHEFRASYYKLEVHSVSVNEVQIHEGDPVTASCVFDLAMDAYTEGKTEKHIYNGSGRAALDYTSGGWMIQSIELPQAI